MKGTRSRIRGHLPHPAVEGASLCGDLSSVEPCPGCLERLHLLLSVHIQSIRKPDKGFCGLLLRGDRGALLDDPKLALPPLYVSPEQARRILDERRGAAVRSAVARSAERSVLLLADVFPQELEFCVGCRMNLERFDEAASRRNGHAVVATGRAGAAAAPADEDDVA